jgi:hypothetical protein
MGNGVGMHWAVAALPLTSMAIAARRNIKGNIRSHKVILNY